MAIANIIKTGLYGEAAYTLVNVVGKVTGLGNLVLSKDSESACNYKADRIIDRLADVIYGLDNEVYMTLGYCSMEKDVIISEILDMMKQLHKEIKEEIPKKEEFCFIPCEVHTTARSNANILKELKNPGWPFGESFDWYYLKTKPHYITINDVENVIAQLKNHNEDGREEDPFVIESRRTLAKSFLEVQDALDINSLFLAKWMKDPKASVKSLKKLLNEEAKLASSKTLYFKSFGDYVLARAETPLFKQLLDLIESIRKLNWMDPVIMLKKKYILEKIL